jgi:hypothetical protein
MITIPLALLLLIGILVSLTKGKGTPFFGFLCVVFGIVIANTDFGRAIVQVVRDLINAATNAAP